MKKILICYAAGSVGALASCIAAWLAGDLGVTRMAGVSMAPALTSGWLYPRILWGGLWGLLFLLPVIKSRTITRGTLFSLFPTLVQLFIIFPDREGYGIAGIRLGLLTPVFIFLYNWIWGIVTSLTIRFSR
jgi:hypothetical protein